MIGLLFLAYAFGALGFMGILSAAMRDASPAFRIRRVWVLAAALAWPLVVAAAFAVLAIAVVTVVLYGVSEL